MSYNNVIKMGIPRYCYLCGKEILPSDKSPEIIKTKRQSTLYIHSECIKKGRN